MIDIDLFLLVYAFILSAFGIAISIWALMPRKKENTNQLAEQEPEKDYVKPQLKPLTEEQIAEIHARGKITPAEKLAEWESMDLCAPGDAIGSASWRCKKFKYNCHDCLVDFANQQDEYTSIYQRMREVNSTSQDTNLKI